MKTIAAIAVLLAGAAFSQAEGLLGQRYAEAQLGYMQIDAPYYYGGDADVIASGARIHLPVLKTTETRAFGIDFDAGLGYAAADYDYYGDDVETSTIDGNGIFYYELSKSVKAYVAGGLGFAAYDYDDDWGSEEDDWFYTFSFGVEFIFIDNLVITPSATYTDLDDFGDAWSYAVDANYWISDLIGLGFGIGYEDEDAGEAISYIASVRFRF